MRDTGSDRHDVGNSAAPQRNMQITQPPLGATGDRNKDRTRRVQPGGQQLPASRAWVDSAVDQLPGEFCAGPAGVFEGEMGLRQFQCDDRRRVLDQHTIEGHPALTDDGQHRMLVRRHLTDQHLDPSWG